MVEWMLGEVEQWETRMVPRKKAVKWIVVPFTYLGNREGGASWGGDEFSFGHAESEVPRRPPSGDAK